MANEKRLIDANALSQVIRESYERMDGLIPDAPRRHMAKAALLSTIDLIAETPTVDAVEVVHGRWIEDSIEFKGERPLRMYQCTECDGIVYHYKTNYCPNCGADMRERKDNERKAD